MIDLSMNVSETADIKGMEGWFCKPLCTSTSGMLQGFEERRVCRLGKPGISWTPHRYPRGVLDPGSPGSRVRLPPLIMPGLIYMIGLALRNCKLFVRATCVQELQRFCLYCQVSFGLITLVFLNHFNQNQQTKGNICWSTLQRPVMI